MSVTDSSNQSRQWFVLGQFPTRDPGYIPLLGPFDADFQARSKLVPLALLLDGYEQFPPQPLPIDDIPTSLHVSYSASVGSTDEVGMLNQVFARAEDRLLQAELRFQQQKYQLSL